MIWSGGRAIKNIFISSHDGEAHGKITTFSSVQEAVLVRLSLDLATLWRRMWKYSEVLHFTAKSLHVQMRRARSDPKTVKWMTWTLFNSPCSEENYFGVVLCRSLKTRQFWLLFWCMCEKCWSVHLNNSKTYLKGVETAVAQWLRCCVTNRKVAGSIPGGVIGIFYWHNPSDRTMALGLTQSLTEMSTRSISWGKSGRCVRLTTLPSSWAIAT